MREIEFRAKKVTDGKWVYGNLEVNSENSYISRPDAVLGDEIVLDSVGQWTGLYDCDKNRIYEGDIVECVSWNEYFSKDGKPMEQFRRKMYIAFVNGGFKMVEPMPHGMNPNVWDIIFNGDVKIIGNMVDNPEEILLREE